MTTAPASHLDRVRAFERVVRIRGSRFRGIKIAIGCSDPKRDGRMAMSRRIAEQATDAKKPRRRWRDYRTRGGGRPVKAFFSELTDAAVIAGMRVVAERGLVAARHLRGDVYEVRTEANMRSLRVLFATEGRQGQVLLSLAVFEKRTQKTPYRELDLAEARLRDWRARSRAHSKH